MSREPTIRYASQVIALFETDGPRLHRLLVRITLRADVADDLLQDLAVKLADAEGFAQAAQPYAYARVAAMNLAFSWRRRSQPLDEAAAADPPAHDPPPWSRLAFAEDLAAVLDAMDALTHRDRLILTMRYLDGRGFDEIGRETGSTPHQARALCHKAIRRVRDTLAARHPGVASEVTP